MSNESLIFRAFVVLLWSSCYIWYYWGSRGSLVDLLEGTEGMSQASRRMTVCQEEEYQTPETKGVPELGNLLGLDISQWSWEVSSPT